MKVIFLGTPDFAVLPLKKLLKSKHEVVGVVCNHDKPSGRGGKLSPPPTKIVAQQAGVPVFQYKSIRKEGVQDMKNLNADIMVTCAFGQILSKEILEICPNGVLNIHGSLLPKYRGPAPIQWAVANGETKTGVTIMRTEEGIDTGPMLLMRETDILPNQTSADLFQALSSLGADMIEEALDLVESKKAVFVPQNHEDMSYYPMIKKDTFKLDFSKTCHQICATVRGAQPWPVAYFVYQDQPIKVFEVKTNPTNHNFSCGEVVTSSSKQGLIVACADGLVEIVSLQAPNGRLMPAKAYLNGKTIEKGSIL